MDLITLDRGFLKQDEIDKFESAIWTERYYGDSDFELVVEPTNEMIQKLKYGTFLSLDTSDEVMIIDTLDIEEGYLKATGAGLLPFLNNRFIRVSAQHEDRYWYVNPAPPGQVLADIVYNMCIAGPILDGTIPIGISNPSSFIIPGLSIKDYDKVGSPITIGVPYGPVYTALRDIATTYLIGIQITLESADQTGYSIQFRSYRGLDHTSNQTVNPIIRFSPQMDSLTNIKELKSIKDYKTHVYSYAPGNPSGLASTPGFDSVWAVHPVGGGDIVSSGAPSSQTGFDLRALMVLADDITTDEVGGDAAALQRLLSQRASLELSNHRAVNIVDGEIVPLHQFQYGVHYNLGDIIEVEGKSGAVQSSRVTEYIRSQSSAGQKDYPTVAMLS